MKASDLIADAMSEWRPMRSASDLAHETFAKLDPDEVERLALRGYTEEIRKALRRKVKGVPQYSNIDRIDPVTGDKQRVYKQTELFTVADYEATCASYLLRAADNRRVAVSLAAQCKARHNVNPMPRRKAS